MTIPPKPHEQYAVDFRRAPIPYRGLHIHVDVQVTPDCVYGIADLLEGQAFKGRLSIGSPKATAKDLRTRLVSLAQARIDIMKAAARQ